MLRRTQRILDKITLIMAIISIISLTICIAVSYDKQDIIIDILTSHLPHGLKKGIETVVNAVVCFFCALMSHEAVRQMQLNWTKSMSISSIPTRYYIVTMIFSFAIVSLIYLLKVVESAKELTGGKTA